MSTLLTAELVTRREILVSVPDHLEIVRQNGFTYIVDPDDKQFRVLLSTTVALQRGLLKQVDELPGNGKK